MSNKELPNLNIVIIGHVDSGKSTTCGQLIAHLGKIDKRTLEKYEKEANEMGKGSFKWAWVMDNLQAERERGITINNSLNELYTKTKKITIIDAPGHRDFIKNMITGTSQADAAILMISGGKGEFEAGISDTGQTREHAMLAQTLGIKNFVVCINKMDTNNFDQTRFNEIKSYMTDFLTQLNYTDKNMTFVPISGFHGDNLVERSERCAWYKGPILMEAMDAIEIPKRPVKKPLRLPVQCKYKITGVGCVCSGRVETGVIRENMPIVFAPGNVKADLKSLEMHKQPVPEALPGMNVGFNIKGCDNKAIKKGMVVGNPKDNPPREVVSFTARVIILNHNGEIRRGYSPVIHVHVTHVTCKIMEMANSFDRRTGKVLEENPQFIKKDVGAILTLKPEKPIVVEPFKKFAPLGRFSMRDSKMTVGVGCVISVEYKE